MIGLDAWVLENLWGILVGGAGLVVTVVTIKLTLAETNRNVNRLADRLDHIERDHGGRIGELERHQAERLGYERAVREANDRQGGQKP